ncbi:MAG TPA: DNA polymerase I, partial [Burkholderiaceae bacterium]|nr:DNA polymerase I [Burkholderiaceae bacterium]
DQIVDYLMLVGDTSDNVPGVRNVGPKTAERWLKKYGSLENIIKEADSIKGVTGENLRAAIPDFELTRQLLTVRTDCEVPVLADGWDALKLKPQDTKRLIELFDHYGFRSWLREVSGDPERIPENDARIANPDHETPDTIKYETILDWDSFDRCLQHLKNASLVALDTETTSLDPMTARLVGISFCTKPGKAFYIPLEHTGVDQPKQLAKTEVLERLRPWLESSDAAKLLHNAKYDAHVLANEGLKLVGITDDTMLQAYVLESHRRVNLNDVAERWIGKRGTDYETICGKGAKQIGFDEVDVETAAFYACEDADFTLQVHQVLRPKIAAEKGLNFIYELEVKVSDVLTTIERTGVCIDKKLLAQQSKELAQRLKEFEEKAHELAGEAFNLNSPKQLGEILFEKMDLPVLRKTAGGAPSTNEAVLSELALDYPLPDIILQYRELAKLKSTYTDKLPKMINPATGRVHTRYAQAAVVTGRLSSSDPNLQNIPVRTPEGRRVRTAFIAGSGKVLSADYSQVELRVMAHVSGDERLRQAFAEGKDIHRATAAEVFNVSLDDVTADQRRAAKTINFGLIYGMGEFGLANALGITRDAAKAYIDRYFNRYPGVAHYMDEIRKLAAEQGYVETVFGRRLSFPELRGAKGPRQKAAERAAINAPMQGTAADLIKMAMVDVQAWLEQKQLKSRLVMQVHDELVFDVPENEVDLLVAELPALMCGTDRLDVPLIAEVGVGANWEEAH